MEETRQDAEKLSRRRKAGFVWNALSIVAAGSSSVFLLMVVKRATDIEIGAYYSVAVAVANVMINIGNLNSYGYQISDVLEKYSFRTYLVLRRIAVCAMLLISAGYICVQAYEMQKAVIVYLYCAYRAIYAYADVYQGRYQQKDRVDLAGKMQFFKVMVPDIALAIVVLVSHNVVYAIGIGMFVEIIYIMIYNQKHREFLIDTASVQTAWCMGLFRQCLPLFFSAFTTTYILNSSKYAIDKLLDSEAQVYYSILLLPATTVHMIASFVYRPILTDLAKDWTQGAYLHLKRQIKIVLLIIFSGTVMVELLSGPIILPLLEWLYAAPELRDYHNAFYILLLAGGMNACVTFFSSLIIIMRMQDHMFWIYSVAFVASLVLPNVLVTRHQFMGAAISFLTLVLVQLFLIFGVYLKSMRHGKDGYNNYFYK